MNESKYYTIDSCYVNTFSQQANIGAINLQRASNEGVFHAYYQVLSGLWRFGGLSNAISITMSMSTMPSLAIHSHL